MFIPIVRFGSQFLSFPIIYAYHCRAVFYTYDFCTNVSTLKWKFFFSLHRTCIRTCSHIIMIIIVPNRENLLVWECAHIQFRCRNNIYSTTILCSPTPIVKTKHVLCVFNNNDVKAEGFLFRSKIKPMYTVSIQLLRTCSWYGSMRWVYIYRWRDQFSHRGQMGVAIII